MLASAFGSTPQNALRLLYAHARQERLEGSHKTGNYSIIFLNIEKQIIDDSPIYRVFLCALIITTQSRFVSSKAIGERQRII